MKKTIYIVIVLVIIFMLSVNLLNLTNSFSYSEDHSVHNMTYHGIVTSDMYPNMSIRLTSSLKPINGYSYGNFGVPTTFYARVINGTGTYTYNWFVNGTPIRTFITSSDISSLTLNFTGPSEFVSGIFDYVNVTVNDTENQSASAAYYGSFWYEPELFLNVPSNDALHTLGTSNIVVTDWFGVSPLNITLFVNGKPIYETLTPGWGAGFPMIIKYNFAKTGIYNITAVAYDDSGQRIVSQLNVNVISHFAYDQQVFYNIIVNYNDDGTIFFLAIVTLLLLDIFVALNRGRR